MGLENVKLAAFDMDGTLLNGESVMSEETKQACLALQQQGCKLIISTGRTYFSSLLPTDSFPFDGYVCSNGAVVYEHDGTLVSSVLLPIDVVLKTISELRGKKIYYEVHDAGSNRWMVAEDRDEIEKLLEQAPTSQGLSVRRFSFYHLSKPIPEQELVASIASGERAIVKIFVWHTCPEELLVVRNNLKGCESEATITSSGSRNFEVIASGVSKATGMEYFLSKWGITFQEVAAFGDSFNDLELLSVVGHPIVMENADEEVKHLGKYVAPDHRQNGVAQFIRENLL